jgi:hypothetical protein
MGHLFKRGWTAIADHLGLSTKQASRVTSGWVEKDEFALNYRTQSVKADVRSLDHYLDELRSPAVSSAHSIGGRASGAKRRKGSTDPSSGSGW